MKIPNTTFDFEHDHSYDWVIILGKRVIILTIFYTETPEKIPALEPYFPSSVTIILGKMVIILGKNA